MTINKSLEETTLTLELVGRLDTMTAPELEPIIANELGEIKNLVFDFSKLEYISSAGLRVMLSAQKTMNKKGTMVIKHANETIKEVFEITGFSDIFTIEA